MYGARTDALNRSAPTDRLIAVWETGPFSRPNPIASAGELPRIIESDGPAFTGLPSGGSTCLLEVPADINRLRAKHPGIAELWGTAVRQAFLAAFARGYRAVGFLREETPHGRRCFYRLDFEPAPDQAPMGFSTQPA